MPNGSSKGSVPHGFGTDHSKKKSAVVKDFGEEYLPNGVGEDSLPNGIW